MIFVFSTTETVVEEKAKKTEQILMPLFYVILHPAFMPTSSA